MYLFIYFDLDELCLALVFRFSKCFQTFWIFFLVFLVLSEGLYSVNAAFITWRTAGPPPQSPAHVYSLNFDFQSQLGEESLF